MTNSTRSSAASASGPPLEPAFARYAARTLAGRLEWKPSRCLLAAIGALTLLAPFAVLASEMPRGAAWLLACAALLYGLRVFAIERRRPHRSFVFAGDDAPVLVDGQPAEDVTVRWRGPLAFVRWRGADGCVRTLGWWPDTLPAARRRELRLAAPAPPAAPETASMAP